MQASNFGGTFHQLFLCIFFMKFSQKMPLYFFHTMVQKSKMKGSCLNLFLTCGSVQSWMVFLSQYFHREESSFIFCLSGNVISSLFLVTVSPEKLSSWSKKNPRKRIPVPWSGTLRHTEAQTLVDVFIALLQLASHASEFPGQTHSPLAKLAFKSFAGECDFAPSLGLRRCIFGTKVAPTEATFAATRRGLTMPNLKQARGRLLSVFFWSFWRKLCVWGTRNRDIKKKKWP